MNNPLIPGMHDMGAGVIGLLGFAVWGFFSLLSLSITIGLIFLLVRFLLVATRAAQLYLRKNEPLEVPAAPHPTPASPTTPAAAPPSTPAASSTEVSPSTPAESAVTETIQKASVASTAAGAATAATKVMPVTPVTSEDAAPASAKRQTKESPPTV